MRRIFVLGAAAMLAVLPSAAHAQSAPATSSQEVIKESTTVVVKEAPKPSPFAFTPYGFILLNAFWSDTPFSSKLYPGQVLPCPAMGTTTGCSVGGSFTATAQQTRVGFNLAYNDTAGWTKAMPSLKFKLNGSEMPGRYR
jgi:hypothetical protein